jgi:DNA-binding NtrC family response regulator
VAATILVVDDEEVVRFVVRDMLEPEGYTVLDTEDPQDALRLAREQTVHLLLTDVVMPGMRGDELAERVSEESPATRILLMSAHTSAAPADGARPFIGKPFTIQRLSDTVRQVLGEAPTAAA